MKKKNLVIIGAVLAAGMLAGCGNTTKTDEKEIIAEVESEKTEKENIEADAEESEVTETEEKTDEEAAKEVADLIDAIYVQQRTEDTDAQCEAAKAGWDALTDAQKELVEGEEADPDYFGRDTGDASRDRTLNEDGIGENEILVVSFGTSFNDSRAADISSVEMAIQKEYPDWSVRRAFTAQIIINHIQARDGMKIDNMDQALERATANGVKNLVVQPTHLMHGAEYDELMESLERYQDKFQSIEVAEPLLGEVGNDAAVINEDKEKVSRAVVKDIFKMAGYPSVKAAIKDKTAFVLMGHGTSHTAKVTYSQMQTQMDRLGYKNVFVGTVEGEPEETACEKVMEAVKEAGYEKVILRPLMVVAGDHANNDMAGEEEDSWKSMFEASGDFKSVDAQIVGLGQLEEVQKLYIAHTADAIKALEKKTADSVLEDGVYQADFNTDSGMFHVNEMKDGKGELTVKDGKMTIHVSLASTGIVNLFLGTAEDAQKEGAEILKHSVDPITYDDGITEDVYGFDIPVPYLDKEFDVALVGQKGKWYDHRVSVSNAEKVN